MTEEILKDGRSKLLIPVNFKGVLGTQKTFNLWLSTWATHIKECMSTLISHPSNEQFESALKRVKDDVAIAFSDNSEDGDVEGMLTAFRFPFLFFARVKLKNTNLIF